MRRLLLLLLLVCLGAPATAQGLYREQIFGIGDLRAADMFDSKRFQALDVGSTRMLADWDVALVDGWESHRVDAWYKAALASGVRPLLSFQGIQSRRVPSVRRYQAGVRAAMRRWPRIKEWQVWNEANHVSQPVTYRHPRRAAMYARAFERIRCRGCTVVPITMTVSMSVQGRRWTTRFLRAYGKTPRIWALHNYGDVNRFSDNRIKSFMRRHPRGRIWFTETGGFVRFDGQWQYSLQRQVRATRFAFAQARRFRSRVDRMYWWEWRGASNPRKAPWDTALVNHDNSPRSAYRVALRQRYAGYTRAQKRASERARTQRARARARAAQPTG